MMNRIFYFFIIISLFTLTCCLQKNREQPLPQTKANNSLSATARIPNEPCDAPTNLIILDNASPLPNHNLKFIWTASPTALSYNVVVKNAAGTTVYSAQTTATFINSTGTPFWVGQDYHVEVTSNCASGARSGPLSGDITLTGGGTVTVLVDNLDAVGAPASKTTDKIYCSSNTNTTRPVSTVTLTELDPTTTTPSQYKAVVFTAGGSCNNRLCFGDVTNSNSIRVTTGDWVAYIPVNLQNTTTWPTNRWKIIKVDGLPGATSSIYEFANGLLTSGQKYKVKVYPNTYTLLDFGPQVSNPVSNPINLCY